MSGGQPGQQPYGQQPYGQPPKPGAPTAYGGQPQASQPSGKPMPSGNPWGMPGGGFFAGGSPGFMELQPRQAASPFSPQSPTQKQMPPPPGQFYVGGNPYFNEAPPQAPPGMFYPTGGLAVGGNPNFDEGEIQPPGQQPPPPLPPGQQPPGQQPPGQQPPTQQPPGQPPAQQPGPPGTGRGTGGNPASGLPTPGSYPNGSRFWQMDQWLGVPYLQTYGGQPAPYDSLGSQILNTLRMYDAGAGRFTANAAQRYGYQGGTQQWRPDANPYGQPIPPYQWNPQNPTGGWPQQPPAQQPPVQQPPKQPPGQQPPPGQAPRPAVDHNANFRALMAEDPRLAYAYQSHGNAPAWWSNYANRLSLFGGDENAMIQFNRANSPISSNAAPLTMEEMARLNRMQGITQ